jgi:hypothetical protein
MEGAIPSAVLLGEDNPAAVYVVQQVVVSMSYYAVGAV